MHTCIPFDVYTSKFSSVQSFIHVRLFATPWTTACQASLSIINSWSLLNSCPLSQWCHPTSSSSVVPFSSCLQSFLASGSFPMSQLFASGGQSIRASASASALPLNIQDWFPLGLSALLSWQSKGLLRIFSTAQFKSINSLVLRLLYGRCNRMIILSWRAKVNRVLPRKHTGHREHPLLTTQETTLHMDITR